MRTKALACVILLTSSTAALAQMSTPQETAPLPDVKPSPTPTPIPSPVPTPLPKPTGTPSPQPQ